MKKSFMQFVEGNLQGFTGINFDDLNFIGIEFIVD